MGFLSFFGNILIACGPLLVMWWTVIAKRPQLIIVTLSSAFFWLMGILTLSLVWLIPAVKVSPAPTPKGGGMHGHENWANAISDGYCAVCAHGYRLTSRTT